MRIAFIGCMVMSREISYEIYQSENSYRTWWLDQGLHDTPEQIRAELQGIIDSIEITAASDIPRKGFDMICIGYGLCSKGIIGLQSRSIPLVIPKCEDCISLFLGSSSQYYSCASKYPGTYWYTSGWIENAFTPSRKNYDLLLKHYESLYGIENAEYLLQATNSWMNKYCHAAYICSPIFQCNDHIEYVRSAADDFDWNYTQIEGSMTLFHRLMNGPWDKDDFVICPPKHTIINTFDPDLFRAIPIE